MKNDEHLTLHWYVSNANLKFPLHLKSFKNENDDK